MSEWTRQAYERSFTANCFSFTPYCGSVGWEARWGEDGPALKDDPRMRRLLELEQEAAPVALWAQRVARQIDQFPPCGWGFPEAVESICTNIGCRDADALQTVSCYAVGPSRLLLLSHVAILLDGWLKEIASADVAAALARRGAAKSWTRAAHSVPQALGERTDAKRLLIRRLLLRLRFWLRAPYGRGKGDANPELGYLYTPELALYGGWDYMGFEFAEPEARELDQRISDALDHAEKWIDRIASTWPCAPKVLRFLERLIAQIGLLDADAQPPECGVLLPVEGTYLDSDESRTLYRTAIHALANACPAGSGLDVPDFPGPLDEAWSKRLTRLLAEPDPNQRWLVGLLLVRVILFEQEFRSFHFTRGIQYERAGR